MGIGGEGVTREKEQGGGVFNNKRESRNLTSYKNRRRSSKELPFLARSSNWQYVVLAIMSTRCIVLHHGWCCWLRYQNE